MKISIVMKKINLTKPRKFSANICFEVQKVLHFHICGITYPLRKMNLSTLLSSQGEANSFPVSSQLLQLSTRTNADAHSEAS